MDTGDVLYLKGKIYTCEVQDCLTNEDGTKVHYWTDDQETFESFKEHFVLVNKNKKLYYENNQQPQSYRRKDSDL